MTELFPVSSLGHAVILPLLCGWHLNQTSPEFLPFLVALHLGTAAALMGYFWRDWRDFALAIINPQTTHSYNDRQVFMLVCVATLPAVIIGFVLEHPLRNLFSSPTTAAFFLIINGLILYAGDMMRHTGIKTIEQIDWKSALAIGACQALALIPGLSRSGVAMVGGVLVGLRYHDLARFSFLLATPIIVGAGVLEVPKLLHSGSNIGGLAILSGIIAGIIAYVSTALLMYYFKETEINALRPFAIYCWVAGSLALFWLA